MFCPICRSEYREGFSECSDCLVPLVAELPPVEEQGIPDLELVTVFDTEDPGILAMAKSILENAGIEFIDLGEGSQDFFGIGKLGGFMSFAGPTGLQVAKREAVRARQVLEELETD